MSHDDQDVRILDAATGLPERSGTARRTAKRLVVQLAVGLQSEHNFYQGLSENISEGGLFIATHQLLSIGTTLTLEFGLPGRSEKVTVQGTVRWVRDAAGSHSPGMGVAFTEMDADTLAAVKEFIRLREPEFYDD
jgi:uncharacterized protein (TIGR02266 family)